MSIKKKIGIFGGSFDPVHFGHLNLALCLMEKCSLDGVLFVPTRLSPFKQSAPPAASAEARLEMLKIAIKPVPKFRILDWEIHGQGPAYTIDTVRKLAEDPSLELHLLIGEDHLLSFPRWKQVEELVNLAPPFVGTRGAPEVFSHLPVELKSKLSSGKVKIPLFDISSTEIRERLAQKKYCGHLVPAQVLEYIQNKNLYS